MSESLTSVEFENYGPIKRGTLALSRLHALIGPNDSGKTTALRGVRLAATLNENDHQPLDRTLLRQDGFVAATRGEYRILQSKNAQPRFGRVVEGAPPLSMTTGVREIPREVLRHWGPARMLRLDPDNIRQPQGFFADGTPLNFFDERGRGLGSLLDAIFSRNVQHYLALEERMKATFPSFASFRLFTTHDSRTVGIRLKDGTEVAPDFMSEGMLYFLAYSVLGYLEPVSVLLVEEPENGLHPSRIAEVVRILREVSKTTQVLMATHSPLVINELQPEEVTVVTRTDETGTIFTPIAQTPNFAKRSSAFALGELWLNYANGLDEGPLFTASAK